MREKEMEPTRLVKQMFMGSRFFILGWVNSSLDCLHIRAACAYFNSRLSRLNVAIMQVTRAFMDLRTTGYFLFNNAATADFFPMSVG
jgi:hypothetical protein